MRDARGTHDEDTNMGRRLRLVELLVADLAAAVEVEALEDGVDLVVVCAQSKRVHRPAELRDEMQPQTGVRGTRSRRTPAPCSQSEIMGSCRGACVPQRA